MSARNRHPLPEELLLAALGELSAEEEARVQAHVAGCPDCMAQVAEFQETDREFSAHYQLVFKPSIPPPPGAFHEFRSALNAKAAVPASLSARWRSYLANCLRMPRLARVVPVAGAAVLVLVAVVRLSQTPVVSAGEIFRRAVASERDSFSKVSHSAVYQKLRVRIGRSSLTKVVYRDVDGHRRVNHWAASDPNSVPSPTVIAPDLSREFRAARLDWDDPLSPGAMQGWLTGRERAGQAREEIREEAGTITVTSREPSAPVTEAQFVVRSADYHPVSALYRFQGQADDVEFTEVAYEVRSLETLDASIRSELSAGSHSPITGSASTGALASPREEDTANLDEVEIGALYALHQHNADLGGETEVTRQQGAVKVTGVVVSDWRKAELRAALAPFADLRVELYTAQEAADRQARAIAAAPDAASAPVARVPALRDALAARFPEQASRDAFVLDVLESSQQALAHGFALQGLAGRYAPSTVAALSPDARAEVRSMAADHVGAMRKRLESLFERLAPLAGEVQTPAAGSENSGPGQLEPSTLVPDLQQLDRIVGRLVSATDGNEAEADTLVREYRQVAARLRQALQARK